MTTVYLPLIGILFVLIGVLIFLIGVRLAGSSQLDRRLENFLVEPFSQPQGWGSDNINPRPDITGSFMQRTVVPAFRRLGRLVGVFVPASSIQQLDKQLTIAGNPLGLRGREFYGIRILFLIAAGFLGYTIIIRADNFVFFLAGIGAAVLVFMIPRLWLRHRVHSRKNIIRRNLPDALDMLSVCADAGLGFDQSMQRIGEEWETPLAKEFGRVVSEMSMGQTRAVALRDMASRLDVPEVSSFVAVILQSYELGMGIVDALHAQANQMRIERRYWGQEQARKLPLKMMFPLLLLILPAMFAVILGPLVPAMRDLFQNISQGGGTLP